MPDELRVIGYVRVSTDEQARTGVSLEAQEESIRVFCETKRFLLDQVYKDGGESADNLNRGGLNNARWRLQERQVQGVVVAKLDRLTRRVRDWLELLEDHFSPALGRQLWTVQAGEIDTRTANGRFMTVMQVAMAEWELDTIQERTQSAIDHKKSKGERIGPTPYGWRTRDDGKTLERDQTEQLRVAWMRTARDEGWSYTQIAEHLNRTKVPTKSGEGTWWASTVSNLINRPVLDERV